MLCRNGDSPEEYGWLDCFRVITPSHALSYSVIKVSSAVVDTYRAWCWRLKLKGSS